jgi:hypothetical protein
LLIEGSQIADFGLSKTVKDFDDSKEERQDRLRYEWRDKTTLRYFAPVRSEM